MISKMCMSLKPHLTIIVISFPSLKKSLSLQNLSFICCKFTTAKYVIIFALNNWDTCSRKGEFFKEN
jgi:hypothetical protein